MSETPETDALASTHDEADPAVFRTSGYSDLLEFAQALEIELRASQAEVERLLGIIDGYKVAPDSLRLALREVKRYTGTRDEAYVVAAADVFLDLLTARRALDNPAEPGA